MEQNENGRKPTNVCDSCGAQLKMAENGQFVCEFCHNMYGTPTQQTAKGDALAAKPHRRSSVRISTRTMTLGALLTAMVVVLQLLGSFVRFGPFSISLVLIPIVIGAATCGPLIASWLGLVFGLVVLLSGDAALFLGIHAPGTVLVVLLKGTLCAFAAAWIYRLTERLNRYAAVIFSAIVCPVVNTGVFLIGCRIFFWETVSAWGEGAGFANPVAYAILVLVGANFLFELGFNLVLSPVVVRLLNIKKKHV